MEIFQTDYHLMVSLSFLNLHSIPFLSLRKTLQTFSVFPSFSFFRKTVQSLIFEDEYLDNGLAGFNDFGLILQDFERPFK